MNSNAYRLLEGAIYSFQWEVAFALLDRGGIHIDSFSDRIRLSVQPPNIGTNQLGKRGETREHTFRMSREAYENMDNVRITNIRGGILLYGGSYRYC